MGDKRNYAALDWVLGEIEETLNEARQALESYVESPRDATHLRFCITHIHQVRGSLQIVEFYGASLLAEEMELLAQGIMEQSVSNVSDAQEVLMRSLLQMPIYLDHVKVYRDDTVRSILPLLNDIRALRKESYLTESNLFTPDLAALDDIRGMRHPALDDVVKLKQIMGKLREMYQFAAASVLRGIKVNENLAYLEKVFARLVVITAGTKSAPLWQLASALIEGLKHDHIELSFAVKGLLRYLARELRLLSEQAPHSFDQAPPESLVKNILYYIAISEAQSPQILGAKKSFKLSGSDLSGSEENVDGYNVSALDPDAVRSVVTALREELKSIKSNLDAALSAQVPPEDLRDILPVVKRVADTLAVLGIRELRETMLLQADVLSDLSQRNSLDEAALLESAGHIVDVDSKLEAISKAVDRHRDLANINERAIEIDEAKLAVLKECQIGLEKVKEAIIEYVSSQWDVDCLENIDNILIDIRGGLEMVPLSRAASIVERCAEYIVERLIQNRDEPSWESLDSLADTMASIEYYLERLLNDMSENAESLLDVAEHSIASLGYAVDGHAPTADAESGNDTGDTGYTGEAGAEHSGAEFTESAESKVVDINAFGGADASEPGASVPEPQTELLDPSDDAESDIDSEIVDIFVEEAHEVFETLDENVPKWLANPEDDEALTVVRRAFHTMKGSGRMVEAMEVGELAWSIENMLNRIIDRSVRCLPEHGELVQAVMAILPAMVDAFNDGHANPEKSKAEDYSRWAFVLADGQVPVEFNIQPEADVAIDHDVDAASLDTQTADSDADEEDHVLLEIFSSEVETHLATIRHFIGWMDQEAPLYQPPTDDLQRALHTLKGSAKMAQVTPVAQLYTVLESFAKELVTFQVSVTPDVLQLKRDAISYTETALAQIAAREPVYIKQLDQFLARTAELRELSVGQLVKMKDQQKDGERPVDPRLLSIFMAEEMNLLLDADEIVEAWCSGADAPVLDLVTELDTLATGADQAKLPDMSATSLLLKGIYGSLLEQPEKVNDEAREHLLVGHAALLDMVDAVAAGQTVKSPAPEVISKLEAYAESLTAAPHEAAPYEDAHLDDQDDGKVDTFGSNHSDNVAFLNNDDHVVGDEQDTSEPPSLEPLAPEPVAVTTEGLLDVIDTESEDFDADILEVFVEEADELFEEMDEALVSWESDQDPAALEEMKRALHTMKGGARLSGMPVLGDLIHDYESYLMDLNVSSLPDDVFPQVHGYQDRMFKGVAAVKVFLNSGETLAKPDLEANADIPAAPEDAPTYVPAGYEPTFKATSGSEESVDSNVAALNSNTGDSKGADIVPFVIPKPNSQPGDAVAAQAGITTPVAKKSGPQEVVRINSDLLEELVNLAGETSISRSRLEEQVTEFRHSLDEVDSTIDRLQEQLRRLDIETEAQVLFRQEQMAVHEESFDPLEMDRYSHLQQLSRSLMESASDLYDLRSDLTDKVKDAETTLLQQSRINTTLQESLMRSRMVPFSRLVPRLRRIVRQVASELGKKVSFELDNVEGELDRNVLERMVPPFEHMLRNAVDHGIESPEERIAKGKSETGRIVLTLGREGGNVVIRLADDGRGVDLQRVRNKAIERGLMDQDANLSDLDIMQFILHAGFSTAENVTQISGRGVGMDVVNAEIKQLGGDVTINSEWGQGTEFIVQLPFTLSVNRALMVEIGKDQFAIPLNTIEGIVRVSPFELEHYYNNPETEFEYANDKFKIRYLGSMLHAGKKANLEGRILPLPVILVRSAQHTMALQVDALMGSREIVVKSLGAQFSAVQGLSGATIMGDGSVVVILDPHALVRQEIAKSDLLIDAATKAKLELAADAPVSEEPAEVVPTIMVVDDSVTVRKVTTRFLEREGYNVITAKDGVDALNVLQDDIPDVMLLDIEMPRMDGFEVAKNVRTTQRWKHLPIIMITSRTGSKHREHGLSLGANHYMGKPYQEDVLLEAIRELTDTKAKH